MSDALGEVVLGMPGGRRMAGLVLKRKYVFQDGGGCDLAAEEGQEPIACREFPYEDLEPPFVSPVQYDNDLFAFRPKTDLVLQGSAYAYFGGVTMASVFLQVGNFERSIRVYGDRPLLRGVDGKLRFGSPEPFDSIPLRYDKAYGGVDAVALRRRPVPKMLQELARIRPDLPIETDTPFHYARNPCGRGFMIGDDDESLASARVPNLEFPFDWITPERLAVHSVHGWVGAPLPACMDWQGAGWFPRIAYLGAALFPPDYSGPVRESELGWASGGLHAIRPITMAPDELPPFEFTQGASAGMSLDYISPGAPVQMRNLHPVYPFCAFRLPDETPRARLELTAGTWTELTPRLNSVVIRPDDDEVVMTWCCSAPVDASFAPDDLDELRREVSWQVEGGYF